jgi:hypothetical protein
MAISEAKKRLGKVDKNTVAAKKKIKSAEVVFEDFLT